MKLARSAGKPLTHTLDQHAGNVGASALFGVWPSHFWRRSRPRNRGATTLREFPSQPTEIRTPAISIRVAHKITRYPTANFARRSALSA